MADQQLFASSSGRTSTPLLLAALSTSGIIFSGVSLEDTPMLVAAISLLRPGKAGFSSTPLHRDQLVSNPENNQNRGWRAACWLTLGLALGSSLGVATLLTFIIRMMLVLPTTSPLVWPIVHALFVFAVSGGVFAVLLKAVSQVRLSWAKALAAAAAPASSFAIGTAILGGALRNAELISQVGPAISTGIFIIWLVGASNVLLRRAEFAAFDPKIIGVFQNRRAA